MTSYLDATETQGRIEVLEKQVRVLKAVVVIPLLFMACLIVMGQARPSRLIEAESVVLRDANGRLRAKLTTETGTPSLVFFDEQAKRRLALVGSPVPALMLLGANEQHRVALIGSDGQPEVTIEGNSHKINLSAAPEGPSLQFRDKNDISRAALAISTNGPALALQDANGTTRVLVSVSRDGTPSIGAMDANENPIWVAAIPH